MAKDGKITVNEMRRAVEGRLAKAAELNKQSAALADVKASAILSELTLNDIADPGKLSSSERKLLELNGMRGMQRMEKSLVIACDPAVMHESTGEAEGGAVAGLRDKAQKLQMCLVMINPIVLNDPHRDLYVYSHENTHLGQFMHGAHEIDPMKLTKRAVVEMMLRIEAQAVVASIATLWREHRWDDLHYLRDHEMVGDLIDVFCHDLERKYGKKTADGVAISRNQTFSEEDIRKASDKMHEAFFKRPNQLRPVYEEMFTIYADALEEHRHKHGITTPQSDTIPKEFFQALDSNTPGNQKIAVPPEVIDGLDEAASRRHSRLTRNLPQDDEKEMAVKGPATAGVLSRRASLATDPDMAWLPKGSGRGLH